MEDMHKTKIINGQTLVEHTTTDLSLQIFDLKTLKHSSNYSFNLSIIGVEFYLN